MREGFELAWIAAAVHTQSQDIRILGVDNITFLNPVPIGSVVKFQAKVVYVLEKYVAVKVDVMKINLQSGNTIKTTELNITFSIGGVDKILPVYAQTYESAMLYIDGKRQLEKNL